MANAAEARAITASLEVRQVNDVQIGCHHDSPVSAVPNGVADTVGVLWDPVSPPPCQRQPMSSRVRQIDQVARHPASLPVMNNQTVQLRPISPAEGHTPMNTKSLSIAVTGLGGGVGQSIVKALYDTDYRIVGVDGGALGAGLYAVPAAYIVPYAKDPNFIDRLLDICEKEKCALLFPGSDPELSLLARNVQRFADIGTRVIVSSPRTVEIADDKFLTFTILRELGVSVPYTVDLTNYASGSSLPMPLPFILKPKVNGSRSKDVFLIKEDKTFRMLENDPSVQINRFVAQAYIEGDEYTCGTVSVEGGHVGTIIMRRILRNGDTYKCFSVNSPRIEEEVAKVVAGVKPVGALNVQLRMKDGVPYVFEFNARCSGTTAARALAGFNEPKMIADFYLKGIEPAFEIKELSILRYWKELVVANSAIKEMCEQGYLKSARPADL
ncbi:ATP-grasp domain-containing protein [Cupriavidus sp. CP313]